LSTIDITHSLLAATGLSRIDVTYIVAGVCALAGIAAFVGLIVVPAVGAYRHAGHRFVAVLLSFYVLAAMMGVGLLGAGAVIWIWGRYG
jgi:hypothetical protein